MKPFEISSKKTGGWMLNVILKKNATHSFTFSDASNARNSMRKKKSP